MLLVEQLATLYMIGLTLYLWEDAHRYPHRG